MIIFLDIDGVLVTTPPWKPAEILEDGFMKFNSVATMNLNEIYKKTNASIILTTTHRVNYTIEEWKEIFRIRGLNFNSISKINNRKFVDSLPKRSIEIREWTEEYNIQNDYLIIDDDPSINSLPENIKSHWVQTSLLLGFNEEAKKKAYNIIKNISNHLL